MKNSVHEYYNSKNLVNIDRNIIKDSGHNYVNPHQLDADPNPGIMGKKYFLKHCP